MQVIPASETSLDQVRSDYKVTENLLANRQRQIDLSVDSRSNKSLDLDQRVTLRMIGTALHEVRGTLVHQLGRNSLLTPLNSTESGLNENQQNVLLASLNGVQKALISFADTVATVFGVDTK